MISAAMLGEFETNRPRLLSIARRLLGSSGDAEDAVQDAWMRFSGNDGAIDNPGAWLTTVVSRLCLDRLRSRRRRGEEALEPIEGTIVSITDLPDAARDLADAVGDAMAQVIDRLHPAERVAFILHDMFDVPFDTIGTILGHSSASARQLASRARRRVQSGPLATPDRDARAAVVSAFLRASQEGDLPGLIALLAPDVSFNFDDVAARLGAEQGLHGAEAVAHFFSGRARTAELAMVDGDPGIIIAPTGTVALALRVTFSGDRIAAIEAIADPQFIAEMTIRALR
ncbi:sigma-70 family RNA polymerase sigma factor [Devosia sediminis]|uniref:Sigma-70 family RNA polymerase sigma factor n=1 Tax=Devosia sediminis TaxID=2798801 RepID=A0A934IUQ8_9HYPH|nr:sigma-70 family RNA polymerase sigma factor [Devosia sediminis]MBJ3783103.1 sigma-70 family RNA polymerase sigma factor [Devosia sediminis]